MISSRETGKRIRQLMADNQITVRELQDRIGLESPQAVYKWLHGRSLPTLENAVLLSRIFQVTVEEIVVLDDEERRIRGYAGMCRRWGSGVRQPEGTADDGAFCEGSCRHTAGRPLDRYLRQFLLYAKRKDG